MNKGTILRLALIILLIQSGIVLAKYSGGDGSESNPWQISSKADLLAMGDNVEDYNDCFIMTNDINMAGDVYETAIIANNPNDVFPVFEGEAFKGVFEGSHFKIIDLTIDGGGFLGLFGFIDKAGRIRNLGLENCMVTGDIMAVGSLAGDNSGIISNCYSLFNVNSTSVDCVGGLVGQNSGIILNCYSEGTVSNYGSVGGITGCNGGSIIDTYSAGQVTSIFSIAGGLVGGNGGNISTCYSTSVVYGNDRVGGLVGTNGSSIVNCYSTGEVIGGEYVGGLAGENTGNINNCYSIGLVNGNGDENVGGLIGGLWYGNISNSFRSIETQFYITKSVGYNYQGTITNISALTTAQMQRKSTYTAAPANWDFINIWGIGENQTYPYLRQYSVSDINQDKKVDYLDLNLLAENWLRDDK